MDRTRKTPSFNRYFLSDIRRAPSLVPETRQTLPDSWSDLRPHEITTDRTTLLLDSDLWTIPKPSLSSRVMDRLWQCHCREPRVEFADDYRVAWITVFLASTHSGPYDNLKPWSAAFHRYIGETPEKLIPFFMARTYADQNFPDKYLPFLYTKGWQKDFAYHCKLLGLPVPSLVPEFLARPPALPPKKPSVGTGGVFNAPANRKGVA